MAGGDLIQTCQNELLVWNLSFLLLLQIFSHFQNHRRTSPFGSFRSLLSIQENNLKSQNLNVSFPKDLWTKELSSQGQKWFTLNFFHVILSPSGESVTRIEILWYSTPYCHCLGWRCRDSLRALLQIRENWLFWIWILNMDFLWLFLLCQYTFSGKEYIFWQGHEVVPGFLICSWNTVMHRLNTVWYKTELVD